jgi:CTP synthase
LIYLRVIEKERRGDYHGKTVQVIPHVTDEIKSSIASLDAPDVDVVITEIGGTVGDIEGLPFLEAIRQYSLDVGKENCLYIHLTLVPFLKAARELKTKPTQHSVEKLRQIGIQPDLLICRTEHTIPEEDKAKIALFCNVEKKAVIEEKDKDFSIYEVPLGLLENGIDQLIIDKLRIDKAKTINLDDWRELLLRLRNPKHDVTIAVVGKYARHRDAYKSIYESIIHGGIAENAQVRVLRIDSEFLERGDALQDLMKANGILVPGGFGERGVEGKIRAIQIARENGIPFLGICLGMQCAAIEFGRHVLGFEDANSTEFSADTLHPVICLLDEQRGVTNVGGTLRRGAQTAMLLENSIAHRCYGKQEISERHRHRYEFNPEYRERYEAAGMKIVGTSPDGKLPEVIEIEGHPFFVAVQFHPEFKSQPTNPHPLFAGFIKAAVEHKT